MIEEDWKFIASFPKGAKPCFYDKSFVYVNEWLVTLRRRYKGEKAEKGVLYVNDLINSTCKYYKDANKKSLKILRELLTNSINGLNNLSDTYKKDQQIEISKSYLLFLKKIDEMIKEIDILILSKNNFFSHIPSLI